MKAGLDENWNCSINMPDMSDHGFSPRRHWQHINRQVITSYFRRLPRRLMQVIKTKSSGWVGFWDRLNVHAFIDHHPDRRFKGWWRNGWMGGRKDGWAVCEVWVDRWAEGWV
jgi:hypothetical protein